MHDYPIDENSQRRPSFRKDDTQFDISRTTSWLYSQDRQHRVDPSQTMTPAAHKIRHQEQSMHSTDAFSSNPSAASVEAVGSMRQGMDMRTNSSSASLYVNQHLSHAGEQVPLPYNVERSQTADLAFMRPMLSAPFIGSGAQHTVPVMSLPLSTMDRSIYSPKTVQREQNQRISMYSRVSRSTAQENIARAGATHDLAPHSRSAHTRSGQNSVDSPEEVQIYTTAMAAEGPTRGQFDATHNNTRACGSAYPPRPQADVYAYSAERSVSDVSTLFLAGFPDDITDREFANMFLFAKGFEASMLKYPSKEGQSGANRDAQDGNSGSTGGRSMQTIGFAKFSSREEALNARDLLNGYRIDQDRGFILKAELAKKNLHTKRSAPTASCKRSVHINAQVSGYPKQMQQRQDFSGTPADQHLEHLGLSQALKTPQLISTSFSPQNSTGIHSRHRMS